MRTSFLSAGEAVAYYLARRVANLPDLLADGTEICEFQLFRITLKETIEWIAADRMRALQFMAA